MVGELTSRALRARIADPRAHFEEPDSGNWLSRLWRGAGDWLLGQWSGIWNDLAGLWDDWLQGSKPARAPSSEVPVRDALPELVPEELPAEEVISPPPLPTEPDPLQEKIDQILSNEPAPDQP
jgi:hypothetical protein